VKQNVWVDDDLVYDDIEIADKDTLKTFLEKIVGKIWFDFEKGVVWIVEHPFASKIWPNDQRINTNVQTLLSSLTWMIHELWHGLYDINSPVALDRTNLSDWVSLGVHESQSRLLENIIGRSDVFIAWILPQLQSTFDECSQRTHQWLKATLNNVQASLIRTEADEVSYNLHILMRYEIEKGLMNWTIAVKDLPDVWNAKMKEYLWVVPKNDSEWCLQDVHWSCWLIWYFPTYMLGNIISWQLWSGFILDHPNRSDEIAKWDFSSYNSWFNTAIRQYGKTMSPRELIKHATWSDLSDTYYTSYLINKYGK
jgi:carboxypeptidase Taq